MKIRKSYLIILLFTILPLIDSLNGVMSRSSNGNLGVLYKCLICLCLFLLYGRCHIKRKYIIFMCAFLGVIFFSIIINVVFLRGKVEHPDYIVKMVYNFTLFVLLVTVVEQCKISIKVFDKILDNSSWLFIVTFMIPYILGMGNRVYADEIGYKAFYISQNELSVVIVIFFFYSVYYLNRKKTPLLFLRVGLLFLCGMILNTKSCIIACLSGIVFYVFKILKSGKLVTKIWIFLAFCIGFILMRNQVLSSIEDMLFRYNALNEKYYGDNFLTSILSGRTNYLLEATSCFREEHSIVRFFWGNGFCSQILVEMDLIDIFFYIGCIGLVIIIIGIARILYKCWKNIRDDYIRIRLFSLFILVAMVILVGHVTFMAMSGTYFVLYLIFCLYYKDNMNLDVEKK